MADVTRFRVATYNIHKCRGFDRRTSPDRINAVIQELQDARGEFPAVGGEEEVDCVV